MSPLLQFLLTLIGCFVFNALAGAMLPPLPGRERTFYGYVYRVAQVLAANALRVAEARLGLNPPQPPELNPADLVADRAAAGVRVTATRETISACAEDYDPGRLG